MQSCVCGHKIVARYHSTPPTNCSSPHVSRHGRPSRAAGLGPATAFAVTGSFVVERVFAVPGIGQHFVAAVLAKDITLLLGVVLVFGTLVVVMNLLVDLLYAWIDPRIQGER